MKIEERDIAKVKPYPRNAKPHTEEAIAKLARVIQRVGLLVPIVVDAKGVILKGHRTRLAALKLGLKRVPVHVAKGLSPADAKAWRLADNRLGQDTAWDEELVGLELGDLKALDFDLGLTGFDAAEIAALTNGSGLLPGAEPDEAPPLPKVAVTELGDLIILGPHRLLCGDATRADHWETLMLGAQADLLWTDPPYGVSYVGKTKEGLTLKNDEESTLVALLGDAFAIATASLAPGCRFYVAAPPGPRGTDFRLAIQKAGWLFHQAIVWVKDVFVLGHSDYHYRHEDVLYGYKPGPGRVGRGNHEGTKWNSDHSQDTVWEIPRPKVSKEYPTMKPVELVARAIRNSSKPGNLVVDPFAGSGTTLIACEQEGRVARLMELDPRYCDVICSRWEAATGQSSARPAGTLPNRATTARRRPVRARSPEARAGAA